MAALISETFGDISDLESNKEGLKEKGKRTIKETKITTPITTTFSNLGPIPESLATTEKIDHGTAPQSNQTSLIFGDPIQSAKYMFENYFAPQITAPHPILLQVRRELYRRAFVDIINKELSPENNLTFVTPDVLYNIVISASKNIGLIG